MAEPCVFCDIVAGRAPAQVVRRCSYALAIVPLSPVTPGYLLVIPTVHVAMVTVWLCRGRRERDDD